RAAFRAPVVTRRGLLDPLKLLVDPGRQISSGRDEVAHGVAEQDRGAPRGLPGDRGDAEADVDVTGAVNGEIDSELAADGAPSTGFFPQRSGAELAHQRAKADRLDSRALADGLLRVQVEPVVSVERLRRACCL